MEDWIVVTLVYYIEARLTHKSFLKLCKNNYMSWKHEFDAALGYAPLELMEILSTTFTVYRHSINEASIPKTKILQKPSIFVDLTALQLKVL